MVKPVLCAIFTLVVLLGLTAACGADSVALAKLKPDGVPAALAGVSVTAVYDNAFYVQSPGSHCGLRVQLPEHTVAVGDLVNVSGVMGTLSTGERFLQADTVTPSGQSLVQPVWLRTRDVGGGDWLFDPDTGAGQRGVPGGAGLNNVGLLISVAGKVTAAGPDWFAVDDGSGSPGASGVGGLRISAANVLVPPTGAPVRVTGISSLRTEAGTPAALLFPRTASDVALIGGAISGRVLMSANQIVSLNIGSPHPCPDSYVGMWEVFAPAGALRFRMHFTQVDLDVLDVLQILGPGGELRQEISWLLYNLPLTDFWSAWIPGNSATLRLETDERFFLPSRYGFQCDRLEAEMAGTGVPGVTLTITPGGYSAVSGPDGRYLIPALPEGAYRLTPSLSGASFLPPFADILVMDGEALHGLDFLKQ
ncbi:MAG: hypothetical protein KatS3mg024_0702 [Armatimonadota bacterium]|nr:MAG: hypothetical protein KatS3mg024_0702 [Armatimonadota bacterium]